MLPFGGLTRARPLNSQATRAMLSAATAARRRAGWPLSSSIDCNASPFRRAFQEARREAVKLAYIAPKKFGAPIITVLNVGALNDLFQLFHRQVRAPAGRLRLRIDQLTPTAVLVNDPSEIPFPLANQNGRVFINGVNCGQVLFWLYYVQRELGRQRARQVLKGVVNKSGLGGQTPRSFPIRTSYQPDSR